MTAFGAHPDIDRHLMSRALTLALTAGAEVSPNPAVGAVIAIDRRIVGEGVTAADGGPHAEVRALAALRPADRSRLAEATLYVTLEPCSIYGRTPPCCDRIVEEGIGRVVVGCIDFTSGVCGRGLERLRLGGVEVAVGCLQAACFEASRFRQATTRKHRPYVILKQALDPHGMVGVQARQVSITSPAANVLSHRWRSQVDLIVVGANTVAVDDPQLNVRHVTGAPSPTRLVLDPRGRVNPSSRIFDRTAPTLWAVDREVASSLTLPDGTIVVELDRSAPVRSLLAALQARRFGRLLVEGGPTTLRSFVEAGAWDEYREWRGSRPVRGGASKVRAAMVGGLLIGDYRVGEDRLSIYRARPSG